MLALSPLALLAICWGLTCGMAALALALPGYFDLMPVFMWREALDAAVFTPLGMAWLSLAALFLVAGDQAAGAALSPLRRFRIDIDPGRAARLTFCVNLGLLGITALWVGLTARQVGGLHALVALTMADALDARDLLLENKLFTGMRLSYAALPATGCLAAAILATGAGQLSRAERRFCVFVLAVNTVALTILPVVMSQRLLLLQFLLSAYLAACLVRGRLLGLPWLGLALALFAAVWVARESLTNPLLQRSALDLAAQKLAFYFVNDLWNSFAPLQADVLPTLGAQSLRGLMFLTFTDGMFDRLLAVRLAALDDFRGGGEFSLFTAPYVDFGSWGGAAFLLAAGFVFRTLFFLGRQRLSWAAIYAQTGAALLFSSHGLYLTHQNFLFSLAVIAVIARWSPAYSGAAQAQPDPSGCTRHAPGH